MQSDEDSRGVMATAELSDSTSGKSSNNKMDDYPDDSGKKKFTSIKNESVEDRNDTAGDDEADMDDGDPSTSYSASGKKETGKGPGKTGKKKKKHGGHIGGHHKAFRSSKGHEVFSSASPMPEDFEEEDVITHVVGKKPLLGKVWKDNARGDYTRYRCYNHGVEYKSGDAVYIESQRPDQPYYICCIQDLKMSKRDTLMVHIKWYYRTNEVPEQVYQLLIQDRTTEHNNLIGQGRKTKRIHVVDKANQKIPLTYGQVLTLLQSNAEFRDDFFDSLQRGLQSFSDGDTSAYFLETPPVTHSTKNQVKFEFVLVSAKELNDVTADPSAFEKYFEDCPNHIAVFPNLGGDALLIAPCRPEKYKSLDTFAHLANFMRTGSDPQMHDFWIEVGSRMEARLAEKPNEKIWMSTCGTGIYWLHLRLDSKPKYYTYTAYREA